MHNQAVAWVIYIGPLLAGMGMLGGLIAWVMRRTTGFVKEQISSSLAVFTERFDSMQRQIDTQAQTLTAQNAQLLQTQVTVARIEGILTGKDGHNAKG